MLQILPICGHLRHLRTKDFFLPQITQITQIKYIRAVVAGFETLKEASIIGPTGVYQCCYDFYKRRKGRSCFKFFLSAYICAICGQKSFLLPQITQMTQIKYIEAEDLGELEKEKAHNFVSR
jgi:hypothetical protein